MTRDVGRVIPPSVPPSSSEHARLRRWQATPERAADVRRDV